MSEITTGQTINSQKMYEQARRAPLIEFTSVEERNSWLDKHVDPEGTLPPVYFSSSEDGYFNILTTDAEGNETKIGEAGDFYPEDDSTVAHFGRVTLQEEYRGKGYGTSVYLTAMKQLPLGEGFRAEDFELSPAAYKLWRSLESKGVAVSDETDEEVRRRYGERYGKNVLDDAPPRFRTVFGAHNKRDIAELRSKRRYEEWRVQHNAKVEAMQRNTPLRRFLGKLGLH